MTRQKIEERLKLCNQLSKNLKEFEKLGKNLLKIDSNINLYNMDVRLLSVILENYELGNLIFDKGYIYCVTESRDLTPNEQLMGLRTFVAKKVKWDLELSDEEYEIQEERITDGGCNGFSIYRIKERK